MSGDFGRFEVLSLDATVFQGISRCFHAMKTLAVQLAGFFPFPFDSSGNLFFSIFLRQQRINPWYTTSAARKRLKAGCKSPRHQRVSTSYVQATEKIGASGYDCHTDDSGVWSTARTRWCCDVWQPKGCKTDVFASTTSPCGMRMSLFSTS